MTMKSGQYTEENQQSGTKCKIDRILGVWRVEFQRKEGQVKQVEFLRPRAAFLFLDLVPSEHCPWKGVELLRKQRHMRFLLTGFSE